MQVEHGGNWLVIGDFAMVAYESHNPDLSDDELYGRIEQMARTLHDAPAQAERIAELKAELEQTNKMIAVQIRADEAWGRLERAEIWKMRLAANEQALAGAEGEAEHK